MAAGARVATAHGRTARSCAWCRRDARRRTLALAQSLAATPARSQARQYLGGRIAGQKLRIAELEPQSDNSSILSKSLQRAENSLAMMMAYRDGPTTGGRRCIERPYRLSQRLTSWTELWNAFVCEGEHRVRIDASRLAVAALHSPQRHRSVQGDRIEPLSSAVQFQITWETAMKRAASSQAANQDGCVSPQPS